MKKQEQCFMCEGTKKYKEEEWGFWGKYKKEIECSSCYGKGILDVYICENCKYKHYITQHSEIYTGKCKNCYADIETGKYTRDFFYIMKNNIEGLSNLINELLKKGYKPVGEVVRLDEYWMLQAVIKEEFK